MKVILFVTKSVRNLGSLLVKMASKDGCSYIVSLKSVGFTTTNKGIGLVVFLIAFSFRNSLTMGRRDSHSVLAVCELTFLDTVIILKLLFRSKKVEAWVCREVGAEKVRKKMYNSPRSW